MIRVIAVAALTLLLVVVLYLPAANPPERFLVQVRIEHDLHTSLWGQARAEYIMARTLDMNRALSSTAPTPSASQAPRTDRVAQGIAKEMERVNRRFFDNSYFRSIDALILLASFRLAALYEWLPLQVFAIVAILIDGLIVRVLRSKTFQSHDPEWFALHAGSLVLLACASTVAFVMPLTLSPMLVACLPVGAAFFLSRVAANFHRRG